MPNWCENILEAQGPEEEVRRFLEETGPVLSFDRIIPMPEELREEESPPRVLSNDTSVLDRWFQRQAELLKKYGATNWYHWALNNWGTKWDAQDVQQEEQGYRFLTAWSPPIPVIAELSARYPKLRFSLTFGELSNYFAGLVVYQEGKLIEDTRIPEDELPSFFEEMFGWECGWQWCDGEEKASDPGFWAEYFRAALARMEDSQCGQNQQSNIC